MRSIPTPVRGSLVLLALLALACAPSGEPPAGDAAGSGSAEGAPPPDEVLAAAEAITAEELRRHIAELADDSYGGRGPGSEGDRMTQHYLIQEMQTLGFEPGGPDGSWLQPFEMVGITSTAPESWSFTAGGDSVGLAWWDEYIAFAGAQEPETSIDGAELVFVGYGIEAPEYGWNDFEGADVAGKVLVILNNDPDWDDELFAGKRRLLYGRWTYKYEKAAEAGAVGAIIIHTTPSAGYPYQVVQTSWTGEQFEIPAGEEPRTRVNAWVTEEAARELFALGGHDLDTLRESARSAEFRAVPLGVTTSLTLTNEMRRVETANVLGLLRGSDPELADEHVVYSAHHDHLGISKPNAAGDAIYNGALDNASGVAQVLAIAKAMAALPEPPRRSILLAFVGAEEQGLLGSDYFANHPTVPPGKMAANINYDGGNIWGATRDVTYIGYGKSSLDRVVERYAGYQGRVVEPDQFPDKGYFYRSDQFHFARVGVPAIYLDTGTDFVGRPEGWGREQVEQWTEVHYHQPSDELVDDWSFDGMVADARLGLYMGCEIADADEMPSWNPGDEFEAARLAALAEAAGE
ncbi:MAG: M28 family peptidase [Thermoanaerobaculia bacterium]|nr:M28 family peptidase [Thermoanaerobaculia bacterium]